MKDSGRADGGKASTDGRLIYATGDVHGRFDLLMAMLRRLYADASQTQPTGDPVLVFLGDYVDRGPRSRDVVETLQSLASTVDVEVHLLRGNHEEALLRFIDDPAYGPTWASFGGDACLSSYGVEAPRRDAPAQDWMDVRDRFAERLPAAHLELLRRLEPIWICGDYAFVHAGVRPGTPLDRQDPHDLIWIREPFLEARGAFEKVIVHGHTATEHPYDGRHRIGVDTGAYATSVLTSVRLEGASRTFIQVSTPRNDHRNARAALNPAVSDFDRV